MSTETFVMTRWRRTDGTFLICPQQSGWVSRKMYHKCRHFLRGQTAAQCACCCGVTPVPTCASGNRRQPHPRGRRSGSPASCLPRGRPDRIPPQAHLCPRPSVPSLSRQKRFPVPGGEGPLSCVHGGERGRHTVPGPLMLQPSLLVLTQTPQQDSA